MSSTQEISTIENAAPMISAQLVDTPKDDTSPFVRAVQPLVQVMPSPAARPQTTTMLTRDPQDTRVLVTGASGFIAAYIVEFLLKRGYKVRGTVRSLTNEDSYAFLQGMEGADDNLELVEANLQAAAGWDEAVAGCRFVMHTASPYILTTKDPMKDLVEPAVNGVKFVLEACERHTEVKKVILTSSIAAVGERFEKGHVVTEADWNTASSARHNAYFYSKTLAESAAHEFIRERKPKFHLVVINPVVVVGPSYRQDVNQSVELFKRMLCGRVPAIMNISTGYVDVRDCAMTHIAAMENEAAEGRYICSAGTYHMKDIANMIRKKFPEYPVPKLQSPNVAVKALLRFYPKGERQYVSDQLGRPWTIDTSRVADLGVAFRSMETTVGDCCSDLIHKLGIKPDRGYLGFLKHKVDVGKVLWGRLY